jgi:hypothetical protein
MISDDIAEEEYINESCVIWIGLEKLGFDAK